MENPKEVILKERVLFLIEALFVFIGILLFTLLLRWVLNIIVPITSLYYGPLFYVFRAVTVLIAIPVVLLITNILFETQKKEIIVEEDISPAMDYLNLYKMDGDTFQDQLKWGILLLFLVFIPLDFLIYLLFPDTIPYLAEVFAEESLNQYFKEIYIIFLVFAVIIHFSVALYEEGISRGYVTKRGGNYFLPMSAVVIASLQFGFMHFAIIPGFPIWIPLLWLLQAFAVGVILSLFIQKKNVIFPVIFAHALNNVISAHTIWSHIQGNDFVVVTLYMYLPLLIISAILFIWQLPLIKKGFSSCMDDIKMYFENDESIDETDGDKYFRIIMDILFALALWLIGIFLLFSRF